MARYPEIVRRIVLAFHSFFSILFRGVLPDGVALELGFVRRGAARPAPSPVSAAGPSEGALQILAILQRDSRLVDFLMEDVSGYSDEQIGAAVRSLHDQCREALTRYISLQPVIDGVEGTYTKLSSTDPATIKLLGNVPPQAPAGGVLRHRGWRALKVNLPALNPKQDAHIIAPAEVEIE